MTKTLTGKSTLFAFGGYVSNEAEKTITIKLAVENGTPSATCSCNPSKVEYDGKDVTTTVTVNASITGVSSSNIQKWIIYGHDGDGGQQLTNTVTPSGDKTRATTTFTYTTKATKVTGDSYTAKFEQRAVVVLMDGTRKETSLVVCTTVIVKPGAPDPESEPEPSDPPPPLPGPSGPVAVITGPSKVKAGAPLPYPIDGSQSFDWDRKEIVMYTWDHKIAQESPIYDIKFDTPGTKTIILNVKNSSDIWSEEATHTIEVIPDTPPVVTIAVPPEDTRLGTVRVQSNAYSTDGDVIGSHKFEMKYDANNNGFADESWQTVQSGADSGYSFKPSKVGKYLFRETACEAYGSCANTDNQPESERTLNILNLEPMIDVITSSDQTDTSEKTALPMSNLYFNGTVSSLTTGAVGNKIGWVYNNETLYTKTYKSDFGMFNSNFVAKDKYYGEDAFDTSVFATIQSPATLQLAGVFNSSVFISDEKNIYQIQGGRYVNSMTVTSRNKDMSVNWQVTYPVPYGFVSVQDMETSYMIADNYIYLSGKSHYSGYYEGWILNKLNGAIVKAGIPLRANYSLDTRKMNNSFYADSKGVISSGGEWSSYWFPTAYNTEYYNGLFRANYDMSNPQPFHFSPFQDYLRSYGKPGYISQEGNSLVSKYGVGWVLINSDEIEVGALQGPPYPFATNVSYQGYYLVGVDAKRNSYSVGLLHNSSDQYMFIHDNTGKLLSYYVLPRTILKPVNYGQGDWYMLDDTNLPTIDKKGNLWTSAFYLNPTQGWISGLFAVTPTGELKNVRDVGNLSGSLVDIFVGSDGLVTYFILYRDNNDGKNKVRVITVNPDTFSVVTDNVVGPITAEVPYPDTAIGRVIYTPIGDQEYLMSFYTQDGIDTNLYKISGSANITYPKAYDIGTPAQDVWIGSKVDEGLIFQGDMKPTAFSNNGAGYVYLAQDQNNYYSAEFENGQFKVKHVVNGIAYEQTSKSYSLVPGQTYSVRFVPETGGGFSVHVNKVKQATIPYAAWTSGKYGVISRGQSGVVFSNASTEVPSNKVIGKIFGVVLVNEPLTYDVKFDDPESDKRITAGEAWYYQHNPNVFLNPLGTWSGVGQAFSTPVTTFAQPGEYPFRFKTRDDPNTDHLYPDMAFNDYRQESNEVNGTIRVHRRPIANHVTTADSSGNVSTTDYSYDPDRFNPTTGAYSTEATGLDYQTTRGVFTKRWRMLAPNSTQYQYLEKPPTKVTVSGHYILELQVQDEYGAWAADWAVQQFDVSNATSIRPPLAGFTVLPALTYRGVPVTIHSTASDPQDGDRTMLPHQWYINGVFASDSRTTWTKTFNTLGKQDIKQYVWNSFGLSDYATGTVSIVNRIPLANITVPSGTNINPTIFEVARPTIQWSYSDADSDIQRVYNVRIYNEKGTQVAASQEVWSSNNKYDLQSDLEEDTLYYATVQTYDGYDWSTVSPPKFFKIITNKPPTGDFIWTPQPVYEGDTVKFIPTIADPDDDTLTVTWTITSPSGVVTTSNATKTPPYDLTGPSLRMIEVGTWTAKMIVSDGREFITVTKPIAALPLGLSGYVRHTEAWEANRLAYNEKNPRSPRPADWFWAGEAFVLEAATTDTGLSATKPIEVKAAASQSLKRALAPKTPASPVMWSGILGSEEAGQPLSELPEGLYTFVFTAIYGNGTVKTATATIRIVDQTGNYVQVHRIT